MSDRYFMVRSSHRSDLSDYFKGNRRLRLGDRVVVGVPLQLEGQKGFKSSCCVVDWALKFVKPEGLSHTVEGGTNGAGH